MLPGWVPKLRSKPQGREAARNVTLFALFPSRRSSNP